jgi:hypothetical protein
MSPLRFLALVLALPLSPGCQEEPEARAPRIAVSTEELNFGQVIVGYPVSRSVEVWNEGDGVLTVESVETASPGFEAASPLPDLTGLGPGEGSWIQVTFSPDTAGTVIGSLTIRSDDVDTPEQRISFVGEGLSPRASLVPSDELTFGASLEGVVQLGQVTVESIGGAPLQLFALELAEGVGPFWIEAVDPALPAQLEPGEEAVLTVAYEAAVVEEAASELLVLTDDPANPLLRLDLRGDPANGVPVCTILAPTVTSLTEGVEIALEASAVDGQDAPEELTATWTDLFEGEEDVVCSPAGWSFGRFSCEYVPTGAGPHTLTFTAEDRDGASCAEQLVVQVATDDAPTVSITAPSGGHTVADGDCVDLMGEVSDEEDGAQLEIEWRSDHPDAPDPLHSGWSLADGSAQHTVCDLPCGAQTLSLHAFDSGGGTAHETVVVAVTLLDPLLDPVGDRAVVLGQEVSFVFAAAGSCGIAPTLTVTGTPAGAVSTVDGFDYEPTLDALGETLTVHVRAEIELDGDLREDELDFEIEVVSDEYIAVGDDLMSPIQIYSGLYDGSYAAPFTLSSPVDLQPAGILDLNGDGAEDLLAVDETQGAWALLRVDDGSFDALPLALLVEGPVSLGDFDADGLDDWLALDPLGQATVHLNRTDPLVPESPLFDSVASPLELGALGEVGELLVAASSVDHDLDGLDDLVVAYTDEAGTSLYIALGVGGGGLGAPQPWITTVPAGGLATGWFGPDDDPGVILGGAAVGDPGQAYLLAGDGQLGLGPLQPAWDTNPSSESTVLERPGRSRVAPTDADHDGCLDMIVAHDAVLGHGGEPTDIALGIALQRTDPFDGACLGDFVAGSGEDEPDPLDALAAPATVVVPHAP